VVQAEVAKIPMPEDWRAALNGLATESAGAWRTKNAALISREAGQPIYAVTGATISSRALTRGVRTTVDHFRRRWALLAPQLGGQS
jgi:Na+-translocating ferredoxin:NAD+ oxidoreductase RnfG subunit